MAEPIHSTGRGGAGNIGPDPNTYVPGDIVREGTPVASANPEHLSSRGGVGSTPRHGPQTGNGSADMVPETAMRSAAGHDDFHTGRGGAGNEHRAKYGGHSSAGEAAHEHQPHHQHEGKGVVGGLMDKAKHLVGADKENK